jgi:hypothetical protein
VISCSIPDTYFCTAPLKQRQNAHLTPKSAGQTHESRKKQPAILGNWAETPFLTRTSNNTAAPALRASARVTYMQS